MDPNERLEGWKAIAAALRKSEKPVRAYAALAEDPLPIGYFFETPFIARADLDAWWKRQVKTFAERAEVVAKKKSRAA